MANARPPSHTCRRETYMIFAGAWVWIDHFRISVRQLSAALQPKPICARPMILGGVACGGLNVGDSELIVIKVFRYAPARSQIFSNLVRHFRR
jgi:endonuclease V-like protein UPF0215 family